MTADRERSQAGFTLHLLLEGGPGAHEPNRIDWGELLSLARRNHVLVRVAAGLEKRSLRPPDFFCAAAAAERQRVRAVIELIRKVGRACADSGTEWLAGRHQTALEQRLGRGDFFAHARPRVRQGPRRLVRSFEGAQTR